MRTISILLSIMFSSHAVAAEEAPASPQILQVMAPAPQTRVLAAQDASVAPSAQVAQRCVLRVAGARVMPLGTSPDGACAWLVQLPAGHSANLAFLPTPTRSIPLELVSGDGALLRSISTPVEGQGMPPRTVERLPSTFIVRAEMAAVGAMPAIVARLD